MHPSNTINRMMIVALLACMTVVFLTSPGQTQERAKHYAVSGILFNNGKPFGVFGYAHRAGEYLSYFVQAELGGDDKAFGGSPILTLQFSRRFTLGCVLGPQVEIIQENPSFEETITYLGATTGVIGLYEVNDRTGIWLGIRYLAIDADLKPLKIGVGLILKL